MGGAQAGVLLLQGGQSEKPRSHAIRQACKSTSVRKAMVLNSRSIADFAIAGSPFLWVLNGKLKDSRKFDLLVKRGESDANPRPSASARDCRIRFDQPESCGGTTSR